MSDLVCIGKVLKSHGVRGHFKIESYTENPSSILSYNPQFLGSEEVKIHLKKISITDKFLICALDNVKDKNQADFLRNKKIYTLKSSLAEIEDDDFYIDDLIGLELINSKKEKIGTVLQIQNFGAGDILEVEFTKSGKTEMLPFKKDIFPEINISENYLTFENPEFLE